MLLFAKLCRDYKLDPLKAGVIISHKEGHALGIASNHGDPEHLWTGLGLPFTMDTFRAAVKAEIEHQLAEEASASQPAAPAEENPPASPSDLPAEPQPTLDNEPAAWSKEAVAWAKETGLMVGDGNGNLMLRSPLTREQFVTILFRYDHLRNK